VRSREKGSPQARVASVEWPAGAWSGEVAPLNSEKRSWVNSAISEFSVNFHPSLFTLSIEVARVDQQF